MRESHGWAGSRPDRVASGVLHYSCQVDDMVDKMKPPYEFYEVAQRIKRRKSKSLDDQALLAILEDRPEDADRLMDKLKRRNAAGLSVVSSN